MDLQDKYVKYAEEGMSAEDLADMFLKDYFKDKQIVYPINPFKILQELGILFHFQPFKKYDGLFIPAESKDDNDVVGININKPITRQRFTAAHELCHYLKDNDKGCLCPSWNKNRTERYAEDFAAALLMPYDDFNTEVNKYLRDGYIDFDDIVKVAHYFGVSFQACTYRIAYKLHKIKGDTSSHILKLRIDFFMPENAREEQNLSYALLYEQILDAIGDKFNIEYNPYLLNKFKSEYVYNDSRMEGIRITQEQASEIMVDLQLEKQSSQYCNEKNKNLIEVAGLCLAYDYAFMNCNKDINIYETCKIHELLFSLVPCPDFGGKYRNSNSLALGAKFETFDYHQIAKAMMDIDKEIDKLLNNSTQLSNSEYIKKVIQIHHKLTVIHPFGDGNGRTLRVFANILLLRRKLPPIFFKGSTKDSYKDALSIVDITGNFEPLCELFYKSILDTNSMLNDLRIFL